MIFGPMYRNIGDAVKETLRWVRPAESKQAAKWRLTRFVNEARSLIADIDLLKPVRTALNTVTRHREALNGIFQAAKCRARGYRNDETFISIIYLLAAPIQHLLKST